LGLLQEKLNQINCSSKASIHELMTTAEKMESAVNRLLQQKIIFTLNNKVMKSGKLILFCIKDFYLVFTLQNQNIKKHFEIPYPYGFVEGHNRIQFDYSVHKFCQRNTHIETRAKLLSTAKKPNKFFNTYAEISVMENVDS